jgi:hypothetical protein
MHKIEEFKFKTEEEALEFASSQRANKYPDEDKYVVGPFFMDEEEIFKNMAWCNMKEKWWQVSIETFR